MSSEDVSAQLSDVQRTGPVTRESLPSKKCVATRPSPRHKTECAPIHLHFLICSRCAAHRLRVLLALSSGAMACMHEYIYVCTCAGRPQDGDGDLHPCHGMHVGCVLWSSERRHHFRSQPCACVLAVPIERTRRVVGRCCCRRRRAANVSDYAAAEHVLTFDSLHELGLF